MSTTGTEGTFRKAAENVKETIGSLTGDVATRLKANTGEFRDKAQQLYADTTELARDALSSNGLAVLTGAAAIGFVLGVTVRRLARR
jgi:uncharacterized protein YjbJ (UPF0337 family)